MIFWPIFAIYTLAEVGAVPPPGKTLTICLNAARPRALATKGSLLGAVRPQIDILLINRLMLVGESVLVLLLNLPPQQLRKITTNPPRGSQRPPEGNKPFFRQILLKSSLILNRKNKP